MPKPKQTTLVMLPGLDGTGLVFELMLEHLAETIRPQVVRYPADRVLSFQEHVAFARDQLPRSEPFVLLVESFSGPVGLQLLAEPPANLAGIIFVATFARYPSPFLLDVLCYLPQGLLRKLFATSLLSRLFMLGCASAKAVRIFRKALTSIRLNVLSQRLQILTELPPPPETSFSGPCLYLRASHDRLVPARAVPPLQRHLPQLEVEVIRGPHIILLAHPEAGAQAIGAFIDRLKDMS